MLRENLKYKGYNCYLKVSIYPESENKNMALLLMNMKDESPVAKITVIPEEAFPKTHVCIKNYSENEGMLEWAEDNNIVVVDDSATFMLLGFEQVVPCLRAADDIYKEYLNVLKDYKKSMEGLN